MLADHLLNFLANARRQEGLPEPDRAVRYAPTLEDCTLLSRHDFSLFKTRRVVAADTARDDRPEARHRVYFSGPVVADLPHLAPRLFSRGPCVLHLDSTPVGRGHRWIANPGWATDSLYDLRDGALEARPETRERFADLVKLNEDSELHFLFMDPPKPILTATVANTARLHERGSELHKKSKNPTELYTFWLSLCPLRPSAS